MKLNLDLAETIMGTNPVAAEMHREEFYPELTLRTDKKIDFPDEGTMTIKFKKIRSAYDKKASKPYSCTVEVHKLVSLEGEKDESPTKTDRSAEDALDKLMKEKMKGKEENENEEDY